MKKWIKGNLSVENQRDRPPDDVIERERFQAREIVVNKFEVLEWIKYANNTNKFHHIPLKEC